MKWIFNPTSGRHGHMLTGVGGLPQTLAPFAVPTAGEIALFSEIGRSDTNVVPQRRPNPTRLQEEEENVLGTKNTDSRKR